MPNMLTETTKNMRTLIDTFTGDLQRLIDGEAEVIRQRISGALGGLAIANSRDAIPRMFPRAAVRKPRAIFLCLRKGCPNVGAPIYGMVCTKHKDTPPAMIAKLKAARAARAEK